MSRQGNQTGKDGRVAALDRRRLCRHGPWRRRDPRRPLGGGARAAGVGDRDRGRVGAHLRVGVRAADHEPTQTCADRPDGGRGAVAPVDRGDEIGDGGERIAVDERCDLPAERLADDRIDRGPSGADRGVADLDIGRDGTGGDAVAVRIRERPVIVTFLGVRVAAGDLLSRWVERSWRGPAAITPVDRRGGSPGERPRRRQSPRAAGPRPAPGARRRRCRIACPAA